MILAETVVTMYRKLRGNYPLSVTMVPMECVGGPHDGTVQWVASLKREPGAVAIPGDMNETLTFSNRTDGRYELGADCRYHWVS